MDKRKKNCVIIKRYGGEPIFPVHNVYYSDMPRSPWTLDNNGAARFTYRKAQTLCSQLLEQDNLSAVEVEVHN